MTANYTPQDALLHIAAAIEQMRNELARVADAAPPAATVRDYANCALAYVDRVFAGIQEHQVNHGAHGDHYSTGLPVSTTVSLAGGAKWQKLHHPAPGHPINRPRVLATGVPLGDGSTADVIASAPGVLDVVRRPSPNVV